MAATSPHAPATSTHPEIAAEQAVIDHAYARIEAMQEQARRVASGVVDQGAGGTHQARLERDVLVHLSERRLAALRVGDAPLCFGRTDHDDGLRLYIGRLAVADENNDPLVVDWRAPAAEPFYRATGRHPMGLTRRRHLLLRGRQVVGIDDELLGRGMDGDNHDGLVLLGEGALLAALTHTRTGRMGDIVATIQSEQDEVVRAPLGALLVVQGGPGSGKTAVALHRAAYLLYTHRFPLERAGVLVVGPNRVFLRYIENVLPSLGEHTVTLATPALLRPATPARATDAPAVARVKGDARMAEVVGRAVSLRQQGLTEVAEVPYGARILTVTPGDSRRLVAQARRRAGTHNEQRTGLERLVVRHLVRQLGARHAGGRSKGGPVPEGAEESLREEPALADVLDRMWPVLTPESLVHDLLASPPFIERAGQGVLTPEECRALHRPPSRRPADVDWTEDDIPLLDEAAHLLGPTQPSRRPRRRSADDAGADSVVERALDDAGALEPRLRAELRRILAPDDDDGDEAPDLATRTFGHVVVDEAQDLSPMQWRMLGRRCPSGSMTVVGDLGQATGVWSATSWDEALANLPARRAPRVATLTVNYRTPAEVMAVAERVLAAAAPNLVAPRPVRSVGEAPVVTAVARHELAMATAAAVAREAAEVAPGKVGVVAPDDLVDRLADAIGPDLARSGSDAAVLDAPVAVLPLRTVKGLEFDSVVVVEPARLVSASPHGLRGLYVALTRTTRRLHVVHAEPLPPALAEGLEPAAQVATATTG